MCLDVGGKIVDDYAEMCDILNGFFSDVVEGLHIVSV